MNISTHVKKGSYIVSDKTMSLCIFSRQGAAFSFDELAFFLKSMSFTPHQHRDIFGLNLNFGKACTSRKPVCKKNAHGM